MGKHFIFVVIIYKKHSENLIIFTVEAFDLNFLINYSILENPLYLPFYLIYYDTCEVRCHM